MAVRLSLRVESLSRFFLASEERGNLARFFLPLLDQRRIAHNLDLALEIEKTHAPAKALLIKTAKLRLVAVVIGRPEQCSGSAFARDAVKVTLDWIVQSHLSLVEFFSHQAKGGVLERSAICRYCVRFAETEKRTRVLRFYPDVVTLGFLQKQTRQRVNRIRNRTRFDLGCDIFECRCLRKKMNLELRQWRRSRRLPSRRKIERTFRISVVRRFALVARSPITPVAVFVFATRATSWMIPPPLAIARPRLLIFPLGMPRRRPVFLHPGGKELQVNQIKRFAGRWHTSDVLHQPEK